MVMLLKQEQSQFSIVQRIGLLWQKLTLNRETLGDCILTLLEFGTELYLTWLPTNY